MNLLAAEATITAAEPRGNRLGRSFWLSVNIAALLATALLLRTWRLDNIPGINGDEAWSGVQAARLAGGQSIAWRTPTGNPVNVFFLFPLAVLHLVFPPSFALLRSVAVISGLAAVAANYLLARRVFDPRTALVSTLLLALLPIDIAYSRFAWDASQSLLATVLVLYLTLAHYRRGYDTASLPVAGMLALGAAVIVHPTNLFAAPLVAVPIAYAWRHRAWNRLQETSLPAKTWVLPLLAAVAIAAAYVAWQALAGAAPHVRGPDELVAFLQNYLGLFSGATVYEYIAGVDAATGAWSALTWLPVACNVLFLVAALWGAWGFARRLAGDADEHDLMLVVSWAVMLAGFFFVAGPRGIAPHLERYGICLLAPGALVLARGWSWWLEPHNRHAHAAAGMLAAAAWLFPATFCLGYFAFIDATGGESHLAFRTAEVEPKLAAFRYLLSRRDETRPARIEARQWWNYWPLAYLAANDHRLAVVSGQPWPAESPPADPWSGDTWYVEFADHPDDVENQHRARRDRQRAVRHLIFDASGRPLLSIWGPAEKFSQNR